MTTPKKILVIDDNPFALKVIEKKLKVVGYDTILVGDPRDVVSTASIEQPDLIICDVNMPEMDGGEVAAALKQCSKTADIPIMFLTALVNKNVGTYISGGNIYVSKMCQPEVLFAQIGKIFQVSTSC